MKRILLGIAASLVLAQTPAIAVTLTFNNTASTGNATSYGINGVYVESGFTFTATGGTEQFSLDPGYDPSNTPPDGSDFQTFEDSPATWTLSSGAPFALTSLQAAAIYDDPAGTLTLTGHVSGGGTLVQVLNLPSGNPTAQWNTYVLPANWVNLSSVDFDYSNEFVGIDNVVVVPGAAANPVPTQSSSVLVATVLLLAGLSAIVLLRRKVAREG